MCNLNRRIFVICLQDKSQKHSRILLLYILYIFCFLYYKIAFDWFVPKLIFWYTWLNKFLYNSLREVIFPLRSYILTLCFKSIIMWHIIIPQAVGNDKQYHFNWSTALQVLFEVKYIILRNPKSKCIYFLMDLV